MRNSTRELKKMHTSGTSTNAAIIMLTIRFLLPSLTTSLMGVCAPVKTTGFPRFSSIKDNADAEKIDEYD